MTCPHCNGGGFIRQSINPQAAMVSCICRRPAVVYLHDCVTCHGAGYRHGAKCEACAGLGKILAPIQQKPEPKAAPAVQKVLFA